MWGRLGLDGFPTDPVTIGGVVTGILILAGIIGVITYYKKWGWLWKNWLTSLDHKKIGAMYIIVATVMLLRGLADAFMMRAQQGVFAGSENSPISSDLFQQVLTAHGTIMIFFVAMGFIFGIINLITPIQIGARDVAFPLLNSISFWLFAVSAVLMNVSLLFGEFSPAGWFGYPPLSTLEYSPGTGVDYWLWSIQISGIGSTLTAVNFLTTIATMRRKGMKLMKMPIFVWSVVATLLLVMFIFPILTATMTLLSLDRTIGTHFFTSTLGGNPMMYVNLIWAWGHPEVYVLILPIFGIFSEVVPTFSRKRLFGYPSMVWALMAIAVFSYSVWLHHFFTMGSGANVNSIFAITTMIIAIPTGVKVFNWLFTMFRGKVHFEQPMLWFMGFVVTFVLGGLTGVMLAMPGVNFQFHNTLFLVAHFHNVIIGGVLFGLFAGITYWWPKFTGFKLHDGFGKAAFYCWVIGFWLAFGPLYILGFMGAPRRLDTYDLSTGWQPLFLVALLGLLVILAGVGLQLLQVGYSIWKRKELAVGPDPWNARTLEWSIPSPVPDYNFAKLTPVKARDDWWETKQSSKQTKQLFIESEYKTIEMPANNSSGIYIAAAAFVFGFAIIWHIWWMALLAIIAVIAIVIRIGLIDTPDVEISPKEIAQIEKKAWKGVA